MHSNVCPTLHPTTKLDAKQQLHDIEESSHHGRRMVSHALPVRISLGRRFRSHRFFSLRPTQQRRQSGRCGSAASQADALRVTNFSRPTPILTPPILWSAALFVERTRALRLRSHMRRVVSHVSASTSVALRAGHAVSLGASHRDNPFVSALPTVGSCGAEAE
jgi:hypothetical protein